MQPFLGKDEQQLLSIPFRTFVLIAAGCPFAAFLACVLLSILLHYEQATWTHCEVPNWLPSLSAAVASYSPEKYIWRLFIGVHGTPRLALAFAFKNFLLSSTLWPTPYRPWFIWACRLVCALNLGEIISLLLLTSISSSEDHFFHVLCFTGFATCGTLYMLLATWLFKYSGRVRSSKLGELSYRHKLFCAVGSICCLLLAMYFFYRHNTYCESGVYTLFALAEYSFVTFNILFHSTLYYDFRSRVFTLIGGTVASDYNMLLPMHSHQRNQNYIREKRGT